MNSKEIVKILKDKYNLELDYEFEGSILLKNIDLYVLLIEPHEGIDFKFMIRADFPEIFDRWGNCLFEEFFDNDKEFDKILNNLSNFVMNKVKIIKEELED